MRRLLAVVCMLSGCFGAIASYAQTSRVHIRVKELAPPSWIVFDIDTESKPYGWNQSPGKDSGVGVSLEGPTTVRGAKGESTKECITVYIMPKDFAPVALPPPGAPERQSTFIGPTKQGNRIYVKVWTEIQTWQDWRTDVQKYFKIEPNQPPDRTR